MASQAENVKLLSTFHYVLSGLVAFFSCIFMIHIAFGIAIVCNAFPPNSNDAPPEFLGWIFIAMGSIFLLVGWTLAVLMFLAARGLARLRSLTFCTVVAGIECLAMPFGTVLGIFTLIVLQKPETKALFGVAVPAAPAPPLPPAA